MFVLARAAGLVIWPSKVGWARFSSAAALRSRAIDDTLGRSLLENHEGTPERLDLLMQAGVVGGLQDRAAGAD